MALPRWLAERATSTASVRVLAVLIVLPAPWPAAKKPKLDLVNELISRIPQPPSYDPLPYRQLSRAGTAKLPADLLPTSYGDPYSLFTLFLIEKHFDTIARNTNLYAEARDAGKPGKRLWWPTNALEVKVFIGIFIYIGPTACN